MVPDVNHDESEVNMWQAFITSYGDGLIYFVCSIFPISDTFFFKKKQELAIQFD